MDDIEFKDSSVQPQWEDPEKKQSFSHIQNPNWYQRYPYERLTPTTDGPNPIGCKHIFEQATSREIVCEKCHVGLYIEVGDELKNGHLYRNGRLIA